MFGVTSSDKKSERKPSGSSAAIFPDSEANYMKLFWCADRLWQRAASRSEGSDLVVWEPNRASDEHHARPRAAELHIYPRRRGMWWHSAGPGKRVSRLKCSLTPICPGDEIHPTPLLWAHVDTPEGRRLGRRPPDHLGQTISAMSPFLRQLK